MTLTNEEIEMLFLSEIETIPVADLNREFIPSWCKQHEIPYTFGNMMFIGKLYLQYIKQTLGEVFQ